MSLDEILPLPVDEDAALVEVQADGWAPRDDMEVERALRLLDRLAAKFVTVRAQAAAWRAEIDVWEQAEVSKVRGPATRAVLGLEGFGMAERARTGAKSFSYPSGSIETRKGRDSITVTDEDALLAWCRANCPEAVKTTVSVLTSKLPAHTIGPDHRMVVESGEMVPGVRISSGENYVSATVKLASQRELPRGPS